MDGVPETLLGLVRRDSPSGGEREAVDWLVGRMAALGFGQAFRDEAGNAVGLMGEGPRQVMLLGHIDTVPGEIPLRVEAGALYGRGTVDAKGPLACFVDAVAQTGAREGWQLVVVGAVGEEADSEGARFLLDRYHPEVVIVGEPSGWERVTLGYKGVVSAVVTALQGQAHTAAQAPTACEIAADAWHAIRARAAAWNAGRERVFEQVWPTLHRLESGGDGLVEWARLHVKTRLPVDLPPAAWLAELRGLAAPMGVQVEPVGYPVAAFKAEKNSGVVRAFLRAIRAQGGTPGFLLKSGTADMNIAAPAWGCPALAYGPGDSALDHTPHEHLALDEYRQAVEVVSRVLGEM